MDGLINRLADLEGRFERSRLNIQDLQRKLTAALQQIRDLQAKPYGGGAGAATVWYIPAGSAVVIAAGGSNTADVYGRSGLVSPAATVYNPMGAATVTGKVIAVGSNGDGSFMVISQSCA